MRILGVIAALFITFCAPALAQVARDPQAAPQRIISLNMCTDQLVLALADPGQIVGLSRFAGDARLSFAAREASPYPHLPAAAEAVLALEPDLVITGRFTNSATKDLLRRFGERVEEVPFVRSLDEAYDAIAHVADLVGHRARGQALVAQIQAAIEQHQHSGDMSALIIQRRGYATGTASLTADLLAQLGITLASEALVGARGGFADLETIVRADPDVLIMASLEPAIEDQGSALLRHRALAARFAPARRMALPERLTLCAGPSLLDAVRHIASERGRLLGQNTDD